MKYTNLYTKIAELQPTYGKDLPPAYGVVYEQGFNDAKREAMKLSKENVGLVNELAHYLEGLKLSVQVAIAAGEWEVDGSNDPDAIIESSAEVLKTLKEGREEERHNDQNE